MTTAINDDVIVQPNGLVRCCAVHRAICAWCDVVLREGVLPISHGICPACLERLEQEIA
jgi:hypothetical protein